MTFAQLAAADAFWRPSNQMGVLDTDLAKQLDADMFGALSELYPDGPKAVPPEISVRG